MIGYILRVLSMIMFSLIDCMGGIYWFRGDGRTMSRPNRFLLSKNLCLMWPNCIQATLIWGLSDHYPILLSVDEVNWGSRPMRMLKCSVNFPGYQEFVIDQRRSF